MSGADLEKPSYMTEDLEIYRDAVEKFLVKEAVPHSERWAKEGQIDRDFWNKAGENGLLCTSLSDEYGCPGGNFAHQSILTYEATKQGVQGWGESVHSGIVAPYIEHYGTNEQKQRWLPKLASGEMVAAIAMTEPGTGSDLQSVKTTAKLDGNQYVINGSKTFITNGQQANLVCVVAKTDPTEGAKGVSLVFVETDDADGFRRGRNLDKIGLKAQDTSELFFDDVKVPTANLLGEEEGKGFIQLMQQLPQERLIIAVQAVAAMEAAVEETINYTKERKAFGKSIMDFQNTKFKLAEAKTTTRVAKVFVNKCTEQLLAGKLDAETASMAKWWCTQQQCDVIDECLQLFGGYGYMNEYPIARMYADARVQKIYGGTNEIMKELISRSL